MSRLRSGAAVALVALATDVLLILLTPSRSMLSALGAPPVGPAGLGLRLLALAALIVLLRVPRRALWLLLLATLLQFHTVSGRLGGDGAMYYVQLRSLMKDGDVDLANEYLQLGLLDRPELRVPTRTGLRRTVFSVGPALMGVPFFALGEAMARLGRVLGLRPDMSGYGPLHVNAVALGGLLYGFAAVWLVESVLRRHFSPRAARLTALLVWGATFLHWYMVHQPTMSHAHSTFAAAAVVWHWDRVRARGRARDFFLLGLLTGLAMCVRWQNAALLALPALDLTVAAYRARRGAAGARALGPLALRAAVLGLGALLMASPQMLVWRAVFGVWLLPAPPQGADFVRLWRPFVLETLFSSRHGLLSWTPVLWAGYLGFVPLLRRRPAVAAVLVVPTVALTYVNMCSGDWWAGGSFSNRRFDSLLPVLAFGMAAFIESTRAALRRRPLAAVALLVTALAAWNASVAEARRTGALPADDTMSFDQLVAGAHETVSRRLGSPQTWPASWLFAARHRLAPARFDALAGRYLFYRQNSQRGCVDLGAPADAPLLDGGWRDRQPTENGDARELRGYGRVLVGLDLPETLQLALRAHAVAPTPVALDVNGRQVGGFVAGPGWGTHRLRVDGRWWRRDLNAVGLQAAAPVTVRAVRFDRMQGEPSAACGMAQP